MAAANLAEVRSPSSTNQSLFYANWGGPQTVVIEENTTTVACLPMSAALSMTSIPYVDFYSIDVEGAELDVITSHDITTVPAHALLIEIRSVRERLLSIRE
jgi:FkbM family methyltransferase